MIRCTHLAKRFPFLALPQRICTWAEQNVLLLIALTVLLILRLPNFVEPYWYGDEGIYLTIGHALRHSARLYTDIVDHKTPIIYLLAMVPTQFWFRILLLGWMMVTTSLFWLIARRFFRDGLAFACTLLFVLGTTLPLFEGNIPNGELFVLGFVVGALFLLSRTPTIRVQFDLAHRWQRRHWWLVVGAGVLSGLAILTKVPAGFDMGALGALLIWPIFSQFPGRHPRLLLQTSLKAAILFTLGVGIPIALSIVWFAVQGNLNDYIQFGLLYNFHYTGTFVPTFHPDWLKIIFSTPGKLSILLAALAATIAASRWRQDGGRLGWLLFWTVATWFALLLSNRPYPHYFIQVVLPFTFLVGNMFDRRTCQAGRIGVILVMIGLLTTLWAYDFRPYAVFSYYSQYARVVTGQLSWDDYHHRFNGLVSQNKTISEFLLTNTSATDRLFIWGTNPMLYAQTHLQPAARFTVAFHIQDLQAYDQTLAEIKKYQPIYIVVMKNEQSWPELENYIHSNYIFSIATSDMQLYRRSRLASWQLLQ
jgi:hypothetical protein